MKPKHIYLFVILFLFLLILPILFFILNFNSQLVLKNLEDWSDFAGYFNGSIGLVLSLFTLIATIIIAVEISKIESRRIETNQKFEKQKLLREFREQEYKEIRNNLKSIYVALMSPNPKEVELKIHQVIIEYRYFLTSTAHLFPFLDEQLFQDLNITLEKFSKLLCKSQEFVDKNKMDLLEEYVDKVDKFNLRIQTYLVEN
jgi:hypothetical protein